MRLFVGGAIVARALDLVGLLDNVGRIFLSHRIFSVCGMLLSHLVQSAFIIHVRASRTVAAYKESHTPSFVEALTCALSSTHERESCISAKTTADILIAEHDEFRSSIAQILSNKSRKAFRSFMSSWFAAQICFISFVFM